MVRTVVVSYRFTIGVQRAGQQQEIAQISFNPMDLPPEQSAGKPAPHGERGR